jgi:spermidine/putrescine transport system permease protein
MGRISRQLLALNAVTLFVFLYLPILVLVIFSFNQATTIGTGRVVGGSVWHGFTLDWYRQLLENSRILDSLKNTLVVAVTSTVISTVLGTTVALALDRYRFRGHTALDAVLYLPIIIPDVVMALSLILFFVLIHLNQSAFALASAVGEVSWLPPAISAIIVRGLKVSPIILAHVAFNISFVAVVVRARLADFDRTLEEAAKDLYANEWQTFRRVTLPLIMPGILGGALLAFTLSIDDFVITFFVSGPGATTLPVQVFSMIRIGVTPEVNALSSAMLIVSIVMVLLSLSTQRR